MPEKTAPKLTVQVNREFWISRNMFQESETILGPIIHSYAKPDITVNINNDTVFVTFLRKGTLITSNTLPTPGDSNVFIIHEPAIIVATVPKVRDTIYRITVTNL